MADAEAAQPQSIRDRIAALKLNQVGQTPTSPPPTYDQAVTQKRKPPPPPLPKRSTDQRSKSTNNPPTLSNGVSSVKHIGNQPAASGRADGLLPPPALHRKKSDDAVHQRPSLPPRPSQTSTPQLPALPPRRPSEQQQQVSRRGSVESIASTMSARSTASALSSRTTTSDGTGNRIRAPPYDPASLPPLPERKNKAEQEKPRTTPRLPLRPARSTSNVSAEHKTSPAPPVLPSRPSLPARASVLKNDAPIPLPPRRSALDFAMNKATETPPPLPSQRPARGTGPPSPLPPQRPTNSSPIHIDSPAHFDSIISSHKFVIADFYADYCGPCKMIAPEFEKLAAKHTTAGHLAFCKVDVEARKDIAGKYGVSAMPTFIVFENSAVEDTIVGANIHAVTQIAEAAAGEAPAAGAPPPVPLSSRPDLAALQASKPKPSAASDPGVCLRCRDFSAADAHAARFPRESIPSQDVNWLAHNLTSPFPSATDKARVIFTWLHHNIAYNAAAFFSGNLKPSTPSSTIATGLAVCEGYAGLFAALAVAAGLEAIVISGHGKGYGVHPLAAGAPVPPIETNHAWNAVRIDGGEWKLVEGTWGAGSLNGQVYEKCFKPEHFSMTNEEFGLKHWPSDAGHFFRADGRSITWDEYMLEDAGDNEPPKVWGDATSAHGIRERSIRPARKKLPLNDPAGGPTVRIQMEKVCRHWDNARHGKGRDCLFLLQVKGRDGRKDDMIPFEHDGFVWWVDVPRVELGAPGQQARIVAVTSFDNQDARGLTKRQFLAKKGRVGMSWGYVADFDLVH